MSADPGMADRPGKVKTKAHDHYSAATENTGAASQSR